MRQGEQRRCGGDIAYFHTYSTVTLTTEKASS